ncbi:hypothetical protein [Aquimarina muelleri]|uniref:GOLD domain-containing protein n=1 Tax=Aquimarina muelleri TaxID=279356 RepID=A0A918JYM2_9FLAO|nr:hypothetical protein [Aquimarina muelleri]MCX2763732.1 hypothetical protein [Aquimarina muelleri]GGX29892.1 hypothetical protein GCM10007384_33830 [Aquimarina muelleri]
MRRIKIVFIFFLVTIFIGCSNDDDGTRFFYELVSVHEVTLPDQFNRGETYTISVSYYRPTDCHSFSGFDYNRLGNERTVSIVNLVIDEYNCKELEEKDLIEASFDFFVGQEDSYVFRFWQGRNENGDNQFLIIEVPVL